ncbi:MAG: hypothetical protein AAFO69_11595, partial [Bacteroidota bacterium]
VNRDEIPDLIGVGAAYESEVETIRYDGNTGYVLLGDEAGGLHPLRGTGLKTDGNVRHIRQIKIGEDSYLMIVVNNGPVSFFKIGAM